LEHGKASRQEQRPFERRLDARPGAIVDTRRDFEAWLRGTLAEDDDVHDMAVVLSELASNAAAGAATGSQAEIFATIEGDHVCLEVRNRVADGAPEVTRWDLDDPLRGGGRGLLIVRAYTDSMEIDSVDGTVVVRCARRVALNR
jgi:anti-sigma regulatory factor (Ser/Thr protein kinase)